MLIDDMFQSKFPFKDIKVVSYLPLVFPWCPCCRRRPFSSSYVSCPCCKRGHFLLLSHDAREDFVLPPIFTSPEEEKALILFFLLSPCSVSRENLSVPSVFPWCPHSNRRLCCSPYISVPTAGEILDLALPLMFVLCPIARKKSIFD